MNGTTKILSLTLLLLGPRWTLGGQEQSPQTPPETPAPATSAPTAPAQAASTQTTPAQATPTPVPETPPLFANDRLEQMAAPIALYPDALVAQILMASTYPLEIVEAARWVEKNPGLKGAALEEGLKQNEWDPSVKALCGFPTVLKLMNDNLAWTKDLGDAFLAQKVELMDTIQTMRRKALDAGTLKTTEQQRVAQDDGKIVIQPANPEVIYVPTYAPAAVYGPAWGYPSWYYPGWYDPWPWAVGIAFGIGFWWGSGCWGGCDWHNHCCNVHCDHFNTFNAHTSAHGTHANFPTKAGTTATWQHDPAHHSGVNYRSPQVARQFGAAPGSTRVASTQARGFEHTNPMSGTRGNPSTGTQGNPTGPGTRGASGTAPSAEHGRMPPMNRSSTAPVAQRSGAGPASGRMTGDPSRGFSHTTAPTVSGRGGASPAASVYRGNPHTYSGSSSSTRSRGFSSGGSSGFHNPSVSRYSGGWGGASRGSSTTFGRGYSGSSFGGGGRSFGGSFGGGHSGGSFGGGSRGGGGFGGGGFHGGGGHR